MNKQTIPVPPDENRIEELLGKIQPVPSERFHQKMKQAAWRADRRDPNNHRVRFALAMTVLLLLAGLLITPRGRAWAQEVFQFFSRINAQAVELPESQVKLFESANDSYDLPLVPVFIPTVVPEMAALPGCETPQVAQSYACQVALAESKLGLDLKELPEEPENWMFDHLSFDATSKSATIGYIVDGPSPSSGSFLLMQGVGDFPTDFANIPWEVVPADKVEPVKVGVYDGEYVKGSFGTPADKNLAWSDSYQHRLAWKDGTKWYLIKIWPNLALPDSMSREQLIELAEGLVESPKEKTESPDPDALYSISDAEQISGFDLKTPTLLPLDINFQYARYFSYTDEVSLFYGINNELVIYAWKGKSLDLDRRSVSANSNLEIVTVNGEEALFGSAEGSYAQLFLWWEQDEMYYQMYYYQYFGRTIEKEELIAIAESMQDLNDFRTKNSRPYEYVSIYEQVLGFDAREFPDTPARWTFANVWADIYGHCITLFYKSMAVPGWLMLNQCGTDTYYNASDIPSRMTEQVQIGKKKAIYAKGDFVTDDNGKLIWNPDLPLQQLFWQENGLWIEMQIYGESARLYSKEDLLSYAESLH